MRKSEETVLEGQLSLFSDIPNVSAPEEPKTKVKRKRKAEEKKEPAVSEQEPGKNPIWKEPEKYLNPPEEVQKEPTEKETPAATVEIQRKVRKPKLTKKVLQSHAERVLSEYEVIRIGGIMRCCRVSAAEAEIIRTYMEENHYTKNYKKVKDGKENG